MLHFPLRSYVMHTDCHIRSLGHPVQRSVVSEQWLAVDSEASTTSFTLVYFAGIIARVKVVRDAGMY